VPVQEVVEWPSEAMHGNSTKPVRPSDHLVATRFIKSKE